MKKLFAIIIVSLFLFACKTSKVSASTAAKPAADTALQGDKMKDVTKP